MGGWRCGARTPIFCQNFFLANFQNDHNFPDFSFFHFMISPPNRLFLAYLQKKIFPSKFYGLVDFFHITICFQFSSRTSIRLLYSNLIEIFAACLHPQTTLFLKFSFFSCNVHGHSDVIIFAIFRFFYFWFPHLTWPFRGVTCQKKLFLWTCKFLQTHFLTQGAYVAMKNDLLNRTWRRFCYESWRSFRGPRWVPPTQIWMTILGREFPVIARQSLNFDAIRGHDHLRWMYSYSAIL